LGSSALGPTCKRATDTVQHARRRCSAQSKTASEVHVLDAALPPHRAPPRSSTQRSPTRMHPHLALPPSLRLSCARRTAPKRATDGRAGVPLQRTCGRSGCASRPCGTSWSTTAERGRRHWPVRATCNMRLCNMRLCNMRLCNMRRATRNMQLATCDMRLATCDFATSNMRLATCDLQHGTCDLQHATCN
jgi:hypothetical protein